MKIITFDEALRRFFDNKKIYLIFDQGVREVAHTFSDMTKHNMNNRKFGYIERRKIK